MASSALPTSLDQPEATPQTQTQDQHESSVYEDAKPVAVTERKVDHLRRISINQLLAHSTYCSR